MIVRHKDGYVFGYLQYRVFAYSICLLVQVETLLKGKPTTTKSQTYNASVLNSSFANSLRTMTLLMKENTKAVGVLKKLFKGFLFNQVPTDLASYASWGECEWYNFFIVVRNARNEGPKNYWSNQSQKDCLKGLRDKISNFNLEMQNHIKPILRQESDLTHLTHFYNANGQLLTQTRHLKWNFDEFKLNYSCDKDEFKVWRYYLNKLVVDDDDSIELPHLHRDFVMYDAKKLWHRLVEVFVSRNTKVARNGKKGNLKKRQLILKSLILLYRTYTDRIGPMKLLPYWLRLLED